MARPQLITRKDLVSITNIGGLVDSDKFGQTIITLQDTDLKNIIGIDLLNKIEDGITNLNIIDPYYTLLKDYIKYYLAFAVAGKFVNSSNYSVGNGGISTHNSSSTTSVDKDEIIWLRKTIRNDKNSYGQILIKYLKDNKDLFPEYVEAKADSIFVGWVFPTNNCL